MKFLIYVMWISNKFMINIMLGSVMEYFILVLEIILVGILIVF